MQIFPKNWQFTDIYCGWGWSRLPSTAGNDNFYNLLNLYLWQVWKIGILSYQKRTFTQRGLFDVDLTRIRMKASIKELKDKGFIEVATRYSQYFVTQKAPMSRVCHAPDIEGCAEHLVVLSASIELYGLVTGFLLPPPLPQGTMAQCTPLTSHLTAWLIADYLHAPDCCLLLASHPP